MENHLKSTLRMTLGQMTKSYYPKEKKLKRNTRLKLKTKGTLSSRIKCRIQVFIRMI